jgi:hypothetical protein
MHGTVTDANAKSPYHLVWCVVQQVQPNGDGVHVPLEQ